MALHTQKLCFIVADRSAKKRYPQRKENRLLFQDEAGFGRIP